MVNKQLLAANTTGYVISLGQNCTYLSLKADSGCDLHVAVVQASSTPTTPTNAAIAGSGAQTDYIHIVAGQTVEIDLSKGMAAKHLDETVNYVKVWSVAGGILNVVGY